MSQGQRLIAQESHYELVGQLYRNFLAAKAAGTIPADTQYLPAIERGIGPVRTIYCQNGNGRIAAIGGVEVRIDIDPIKGDWEEQALREVLAGQLSDLAAERRSVISQETAEFLEGVFLALKWIAIIGIPYYIFFR